MPLRRSTRSRSRPPADAPEKVVKATTKAPARSRSRGRKRTTSTERIESPPPTKRSRTAAQAKEETPAAAPARAPLARKGSKASLARKTPTLQSTHSFDEDTATPPPSSQDSQSQILQKQASQKQKPQTQTAPLFNPLPTAPAHERPGLILFAWGAGNFGQFGMGPDVLMELDKPKKSAWAENHVQEGTFGEEGAGLESIATGGLHSILIDEKGTVWTCGVNDDAALGRITKDVPDPENPGSFLGIDELTSWPFPVQSLVDEGFRAVQVVAGDSICAALSADGELRVWGSFRANEGSLGFAEGLKHQFTPIPILQLSRKPGDYEKVSSIANGGNHVLVLTTHGKVYTWGAGEQAQLGRKVLDRHKIHGTVPERIILGSRNRKAIVVGAGSYHSFAVDDKGDVWGWGLNTMGQLGTGYDSSNDSIVQSPKRVLNLSKENLGGETVVQINGGEHHTLFRTSGGRVFAVGRANGGQLGLADDHPAFKDKDSSEFLAEPVQITFPDADDPIAHIAAGPHYNFAITRAGAMYSWGQGTQGELGVADEEVRTPKVIVRKEGGSWQAVSVACGGQHALGLFRKKA